jgi:hypothetical protein
MKNVERASSDTQRSLSYDTLGRSVDGWRYLITWHPRLAVGQAPGKKPPRNGGQSGATTLLITVS